MLVESGGSGGPHAYWKIAKPLAATRVVKGTGELASRSGAPTRDSSTASASALTASRMSPTRRAPSARNVMRLAGTCHDKIRGRGPHGEDPARRTRDLC